MKKIEATDVEVQTDLESTLTSSPSTFRAALGVTAPRTK
jgi:hypothetical protein